MVSCFCWFWGGGGGISSPSNIEKTKCYYYCYHDIASLKRRKKKKYYHYNDIITSPSNIGNNSFYFLPQHEKQDFSSHSYLCGHRNSRNNKGFFLFQCRSSKISPSYFFFFFLYTAEGGRYHCVMEGLFDFVDTTALRKGYSIYIGTAFTLYVGGQ